MSNNLELIQMLWRYKKTRGPDVEAVIFLPIVVAIESKRTARAAFDSFAQIVTYAKDEKYDAVLLRLEENPDKDSLNENFIELTRNYGIGVIVGGETYAPLSGSEEVLLKARLRLRSSPTAELYKEMQQVDVRIDDVGKLIEYHLLFRKFFEMG
ncbi:MAG: hypothetical protein QXS32_08285 [Candidatus Nezhaarchaeales archaeon]